MFQERGILKLALKSKIFTIPSDFRFLKDVNTDIYSTLITKQQYNIKSNVKEEVLQSFISHWVFQKTPDININNFSEFASLSEEFDRMKNLIQIYKKNTQINNLSSLISSNQKLKVTFDQKTDKFNEKMKIYHQIIFYLFNNNGISSHLRFLEVKSDLLSACHNENIKFVDLLTRKEVKENGLSFVLNEEEKTAGVLHNMDANENIFIPSSINYELQEFIVTTLYENSFKNSKNLKSVHFPSNSEIKSIERHAFKNSSIEVISVPSQVTVIGEGCFSDCIKLTKVNFSFHSNLELIEKEAFSKSSLKSIEIPQHVKKIGESAFNYCQQLQKIAFLTDSELVSIDKYAFLGSALESITIPSSVCELKDGWCAGTSKLNIAKVNPESRFFMNYNDRFIIGKSNPENVNFDILVFARRNIKRAFIPQFIRRIAPHAFDECEKLRIVEFADNSQILSIEKYAFINSSIESFSIPSNVSELKNGWCAGTLKLTNVSIAPNNKNFIYLNDSFILGKSNPESENYDVLHFARRNIKSATIPSFITQISEYAFHQCSFLQNAEFTGQSKLVSIGKYAFSFTSLTQISIPKHVTQIFKLAFFFCKQLRSVIFDDHSELNKIDELAFSKSSIEEISIPSNVIQINEAAFHGCELLKKVEFKNDSKLRIIGRYAFSAPSLRSFTIPPNVSKLEDGWCFSASKLNKITVMQNNKNFLVFDEKYILGKSNKNNDIFDAIVFSRRDIKTALIPSFIKQIGPYAFAKCEKLRSVQFCENSKLELIQKYAFANSSLESISIPPHVTKIEEHAFSHCANIKTVEIPENSEMISIEKNIIQDSPQAYLMIHPKLIKLFNNNVDP